MCGLVGMVGNPIAADRKVLRELLIFDQTRGMDSTGLANVNAKGDVQVRKSLGRPENLFEEWDGFDNKHVFNVSARVFLGHNRAATIGSVTADNAHPFHHGHIVGAHNGTLTPSTKTILDPKSEFEVDSEAVFKQLSERDVADVIGDMTGAWALTWVDTKQKKLFFLRNSQRPLYYAYREDKDVMFWASQEWMIEVACALHKVKIKKIEKVETDRLYSMDIDGIVRQNALVKGEEVKGKEIVSNVSNNFQNYGGYYSPRYQPNNRGRNGNSNVFRIGSTPSASGKPYLSTALIERYKKIKGKISVIFEKKKTSDLGVDYYLGYIVGSNNDIEVRAYATGKSDIIAAGLGKTVFTMQVRKMKILKEKGKENFGDIYLLPDYRTLKATVSINEKKDEKEEDVETTRELYCGPGRLLLPFGSWKDLVKSNCVWCGNEPDPRNSDKVLWFKKQENDEYLCDCCSIDPQVIEDVNHYYGVDLSTNL